MTGHRDLDKVRKFTRPVPGHIVCKSCCLSGQASGPIVLVHTLGMCLWYGLQSELHILPAAYIQLQVSILGM